MFLIVKIKIPEYARVTKLIIQELYRSFIVYHEFKIDFRIEELNHEVNKSPFLPQRMALP